MGNCQAAEIAAVVIQHPDGRVEKAYWSLSASQVMASNPGHYVAVIIVAKSKSTTSDKPPVRYLKLLRPDDGLLAGHSYRLVSFEDVLREFGSKKQVRLSRLLVKRKEGNGDKEARGSQGEVVNENPNSEDSATMVDKEREEEEADEEVHRIENTIGALGSSNSGMLKRTQWRPSLQSISEIGNC